MTARTPPPTRPPNSFSDTGFWRGLLNSLYFIWDRLNRNEFTIGETTIYTGTGTPENNQVGSVGDLWLRTDGSTGTVLYVKESGTGDTGWVAK